MAQVEEFAFPAILTFPIFCSAIVLSHIVIATEDVAAIGELQDEQHSPDDNSELTLDTLESPPPPAEVNSDETRSRIEEQQMPPEKPPWTEEVDDDDGGNVTAPVDAQSQKKRAPSETGDNFSEAFNLKHLIYFENSSQNNG